MSGLTCACSVCRSVITGPEIFGPVHFPACAGCWAAYGEEIEEIGTLGCDVASLREKGRKVADLMLVIEYVELSGW